MTHMLKGTLLNTIRVNKVLTIFDMLPDSILWIIDTQSRVVYANQMLLSILAIRAYSKF